MVEDIHGREAVGVIGIEIFSAVRDERIWLHHLLLRRVRPEWKRESQCMVMDGASFVALSCGVCYL